MTQVKNKKKVIKKENSTSLEELSKKSLFPEKYNKAIELFKDAKLDYLDLKK